MIPAEKVVAGTVTDPSLCVGFVDSATLTSTIDALIAKYSNFGGVSGWEYFTSQPGGRRKPWEWAKLVSAAQRSGS